MPNLELLWNGTSLPALTLTLLFPSAPPVLAQFAYGFGVGSLLGVGLVFCGLALYLLRSMRPNLARDHDIFFAAVSLLCGGILFFQGWRLDPILQFGQFLMTGSAIFFAVESIRLRGVVTQQAKRSTPIVDDDRPVSSNYRTYDAELEEIEPYEAPPSQPLRRIAGSRDGRRTTRPARETGAGYDDSDRRPRSTRPDNRPDNRPADPRATGGRPRRRPDAARDLNLRYDAAPDDDYGDDYGGGRSPRSGDRPARRPGSRPGRPARPTGEMEATLEGYDTYTPPGSDRPSKPESPYRDPSESRAVRSPRPSDDRLNYDDDYGSDYDESRRDPYGEEPPTRRPNGGVDVRDERSNAGTANAPNDDYAEFYRDDDDYDTPRTASGSVSGSTPSGSSTGDPDYDV